MMLKAIGFVMAAAFIVLAVLDRNCWVISSGISLEKEEMKQQGCPGIYSWLWSGWGLYTMCRIIRS